jgi:hypothetical protein
VRKKEGLVSFRLFSILITVDPPESKLKADAKLRLSGVESGQGFAGALVIRVDAPDVGTIEKIESLGDQLTVERFPQSKDPLETQVERCVSRTHESVPSNIACGPQRGCGKGPVPRGGAAGGFHRHQIRPVTSRILIEIIVRPEEDVHGPATAQFQIWRYRPVVQKPRKWGHSMPARLVYACQHKPVPLIVERQATLGAEVPHILRPRVSEDLFRIIDRFLRTYKKRLPSMPD